MPSIKDKVRGVLNRRQSSEKSPVDEKVLLDIKDLSVSYGPIKALKNVNMQVYKGSIVAILGSNGAGKTTLLKKVSGLIPAESGSIHFAGEDITKTAPEKITSRGVIQSPEGRQLFADLTVYENLMIGAFTIQEATLKASEIDETAQSKRIKKIIEASDGDLSKLDITLKKQEMARQNLAMVYDIFPVLKERRQQVAATLSGGEQQMLAIGRALMRTPELLVLDEPSLGLAPMIVKNIFDVISKLNARGITVFIVEQNALQTLKIADYAYVLQVGKVINEGKASDLIKDKLLIEAYLGK